LEGVLKNLRERLQNQLSQAIILEATFGVVGQYLPPCICDKKLQIQDNNYLKVWHNGLAQWFGTMVQRAHMMKILIVNRILLMATS